MIGNEQPRVHHVGDNINISGGSNVTGKVVNTYHSPHTAPPALQDVIRLIEALRGQLSGDDLADIDASLETVREGDAARPGAVRRALDTVLRVATAVGEVGTPVIAAIGQFRALSA